VKRIINISTLLLLATIAITAGCIKNIASEDHQPKKQTTDTSQDSLLDGWEADVRDNLKELISAKGNKSSSYDKTTPPVVVFDFDNTCIRGDFGRAFFDWMITERKLQLTPETTKALPENKREAISAAWKELQQSPQEKQATSKTLQKFRKLMHQAYWSLCNQAVDENCYPWQVRFYAGNTPGDVTDMAKKVFLKELSRPLGSEQIRIDEKDQAPAITSTGIRIHQEIGQLISLLTKNGFEIWIVTAGPEYVVKGAAEHFSITPDQVLGMRTKIVDNKLTVEIDPPPTYRQGKVDAIKKHIGRVPVLALGDSWTDAEMLEYAENAILIDRGYADLKKKAVESKWWIQPTFQVE
jgi:phosphoserine phosphatase